MHKNKSNPSRTVQKKRPRRTVEQRMIPPATSDAQGRCGLQHWLDMDVNVIVGRVKTRMSSRRRRNVRTLMMPVLQRTDALRAASAGRITNQVLERVSVELKRVTRRARSPGAIGHPVVEIGAIRRRGSYTHLRRHRGERPEILVMGTKGPNT